MMMSHFSSYHEIKSCLKQFLASKQDIVSEKYSL